MPRLKKDRFPRERVGKPFGTMRWLGRAGIRTITQTRSRDEPSSKARNPDRCFQRGACKASHIGCPSAELKLFFRIRSLPSLDSPRFQDADFKQKTAISRARYGSVGILPAHARCVDAPRRMQLAKCRSCQSSSQRTRGSERGKRYGSYRTHGGGGPQSVRRLNAYATLCANFH